MERRELTPSRLGLMTPFGRGGFGQMLESLHRDMDRMFEGMAPSIAGDSNGGAFTLAPALDASEDEKAFHVSAELPGMEEKDIHVDLTGNTLTIQGEKSTEKEEKDKSFHRRERSYGRFYRAITLPVEVDQDAIKADFKNGVLELTLPKTEAAKEKSRRIEIGRS